MVEVMNLTEVPVTSQCRILNAAVDNRELQSRLYALGMYPGVSVDILRFAPTGDPIQVRIGGTTLLSIRRQEAELVSVEAL